MLTICMATLWQVFGKRCQHDTTVPFDKRKWEANRRWSMKEGRLAKQFVSLRSWIYVISGLQNRRNKSKTTKDMFHYVGFCARRIRQWCRIYWTRIIRRTHDSTQNFERNFQISGMRRTSCRTQYEHVPKSRWRTLQNFEDCLKKKHARRYGFACQKSRHPKEWENIRDLVVPLERNLYGHPLAGLPMGKTIWTHTDGKWMGESSRLGMLDSSIVKKAHLSLSTLTASKWGEKDNLKSAWEHLTEQVDLEEPTLLLNQVFLACTPKECEPNLEIVKEFKNLFETLISEGPIKQLPCWDRSHADTLLGLLTWNRMRRHAWNDRVRWQTHTCTRSPLLVWIIISSTVGDLSRVCSQILLTCFYWARIGRPDMLCTVNCVARSVKKWNRSCDERLARLISYIHFTTECRQYRHVGNIALACRLGLFQYADLASHLKSSKSTSGGSFCIFGRHAFVPMSCSCRKQTAVSHSSTAAEIISLDAGLRLERTPALNVCGTWWLTC